MPAQAGAGPAVAPGAGAPHAAAAAGRQQNGQRVREHTPRRFSPVLTLRSARKTSTPRATERATAASPAPQRRVPFRGVRAQAAGARNVRALLHTPRTHARVRFCGRTDLSRDTCSHHPLTRSCPAPSAPACSSFTARSEALRAGRGTLADAGGSSAAAAASGGRSAAAGAGGAAAPPFTFATAGVRLFTVGISVLKDDVDAVRAFAAAT